MLEDVATGAAPDADAASAVASEPAAAEPSVRDTMAAVLAKYPDRGADGRYSSRNPEAVQPEAPAETETPDQPETHSAETAQPAPSIEPPASWSADVRAKWSSLPPDVQSYIAQREGEAHKAITSAGEKAKAYDALDAVLAPRRDAFRAAYGSEDVALRQLFDLSDFATRDPAGFVQWFAQQHRIPLGQQAAPADTAQADPQVAALQRELHTLKSTISQQQMAQTEDAIRAFAEAKGADGQPLRPHFADVRAEMGRLLSSGVATNLEDAYDKAVRVNDAVWSKVQASEAEARAKAEAERVAKAKAEAEKAAKAAARSAAVNVRTTGSVSGSPAKPGNMRETMEAVYRRTQSAA